MQLSDLYTTNPFHKFGADQFKVEPPDMAYFPLDEKPKDVVDATDGLDELETRVKPTVPNRVGKPIPKHKTGGIDSQMATPPAGGVSV